MPTMQIPENPSNTDLREAIVQLSRVTEQLGQRTAELGQKTEELGQKTEELGQKIDRLDYKFDAYQKGTDGMVRMATTIIIATASGVVLSNLNPAISAIVTALTAGNSG
jgi:predicted RNase H-like nuclease (RuvC/YqgF family)